MYISDLQVQFRDTELVQHHFCCRQAWYNLLINSFVAYTFIVYKGPDTCCNIFVYYFVQFFFSRVHYCMGYFRSRKRLHLTGNSVHATISGWTQMALQFTVDIGRNFAHKDAPCVQASMKGRFLQSYPRHVYSYHKMFLGKNNYCFHYCFHVYINQFHVGISFKALIISDQMMKVLLQNFRAL